MDFDLFNKISVQLKSDFNAIVSNICDAHTIGELSQTLYSKAKSTADIINNLDSIAQSSLLTCDFQQSTTSMKARLAAMKVLAGLFDQNRMKSSSINTNLSIADLKNILNMIPVSEKYELAKKAFDAASDANPRDQTELYDQIHGDSNTAAIIQTLARPVEEFGATLVRIQIRATPGATTNSQDINAIDTLTNRFPILIRNTFANYW